jgi:predicted alpha/beta hydrolase
LVGKDSPKHLIFSYIGRNFVRMKQFKVTTFDNFALIATEFVPKTPNGKVVLINSALGIKQKFYQDFAEFLCEAGYFVYTYDYRGVGFSRPEKTLKKFQARLQDWGQKDFPAMAEFVRQRHTTKTTQYFASAITVGSQHGYWRLFWKKTQPTLFLLWYILMPTLTRLYGYMPSRLVGLGEDLPKGVALQWALYCRSKNWLFETLPASENFYPEVRLPILAISLEDDAYAPEKAVDKLHFEVYENASIERKHILLQEVQGQKVGHFGFFRKKFLPTFGKMVLEWLEK